MTKLTAIVLRHKLAVVLAWIVIAVAGAITAGATVNRLTVSFSLPGQPGFVTNAHIAALYHSGGDVTPTVVVATAPPGSSTGDPAVAAQMAQTFAAVGRALPNLRVADAATTGDAHFATTDGRTGFALVFTPQSGGAPGAPDLTPPIRAALAGAVPAGWQSGVTGLSQLQSTNTSGGSSVVVEGLLGGLGALAVLAVVFASFIAIVPLVMALVAIPTSFLLVLGLTHLTQVSFIVEFLIALIGLGVAIDYSLLVVTRWREARAQGAANPAAVAQAMAGAGRAVVFSGITVAISLLALVALPVPFLRSVGLAGFFIPLVSLAVAVTLLPVLLATIGPRLDWPRLRHEASASRPWTAWARLVVRHRKKAVVLGAAILVALLVPLVAMRIGEPASASLAQGGSAHSALAQLSGGGVPSGVLTPIEVLAQAGDAQSVAVRLAHLPGVDTVIAPETADYNQRGTAVVDVLPVAETSSPAGRQTLAAVKSAVKGNPGVLGVGGTGAFEVDFVHAVYGNFPLMLGLIALLTFMLLSRAFRSVVLALKAVVFNLVSVGAAFGVMVLVWQMGHGSGALYGIPATGSITVWVPVMVFAFLFGLSMDYEVFILSRMREEYDATGSTPEAVVVGIGRTGRLVTSAALILFLAFVSMSTAPMTDLKVMATGLGAGIVLDALVVRTLLVPALVGVLGRWNWWLPAWAARLLRVEPSPLSPRGDLRIPLP